MKVSDEGLAEEQENIEVMELPFQNAYEMMQSGEIKGVKMIMLLQFLKIQNIMAI